MIAILCTVEYKQQTYVSMAYIFMKEEIII